MFLILLYATFLVSDTSSPLKRQRRGELRLCDVELLIDLFHLPYEHGDKGKLIINEFKWLRLNAINHKIEKSPCTRKVCFTPASSLYTHITNKCDNHISGAKGIKWHV